MNPDITISLSLVFSIIAALGVLVTIFNTFKKSHDAEEQRQFDIEKNFVKVNLKLDTFCDQTNAILRSQERSTDELKNISEQMIKSVERIETLFKYKDDHEQRLKKLESKKDG